MATTPASSGERWKRVSQIVADALERPAADRGVWIAEACAEDEALRVEVESLLAADAEAGAFLQDAALASTGAADLVATMARESLGLVAGRRIGPYEIVRELGHGGMGVVYLATRADEVFEKQVAIKVVRSGFDTAAAQQRFRDERRILATLDHPDIARLLDGGVTPEGLSYFVMEYIDGSQIDAFCEQRGLSLTDRLKLFSRVCAAVEYAHGRLVIHRDIKARNILVAADGTPKLLDFGIAKLLVDDADAGRTRTGHREFTIENASPEQIRGEPMTVTSDVYALGVLLYHLVTGQRPCGATATTDADLMKAICEAPPMRPTLAARSGVHVSDELEWVVLKALRKEPDRRYASVTQLAEDVGRLLSARPVLAAPDSRMYRARKFVRRNRAGVATAALVMVSLVTGLTTTLWQARRANDQRAIAEQRLQNSRRVAQSLLFELHDAINAIPGATAAKGLLLTRAAEQLDTIARESPDDRVVLEELATAYHRLAEVQGRGGAANLGDTAAAFSSAQHALAIRQTLADRSPNDLEARSRLIESLLSTADADDMNVTRAIERNATAITHAESLVQGVPSNPAFRRRLAAAHYSMGARLRDTAEPQRALASFEAAARLYQAAYDATPDDAEIRRSLALCHKRLGALLADKRDTSQAIVHMRRAVELDEAGVAATPNAPQRRRDLSTSSIQLGFALAQLGDSPGALAAYQRALALREELMQADPNDNQARRDVASVLWYIGNHQNGSSHPREALVSLQRALPLAMRTATTSGDMVGLIVDSLADAHQNLGQLADSIAMRQQAIKRYRGILTARPTARIERRGVVRAETILGDTLMKFGQQSADSARRSALRREACTAYANGVRDSAELKKGTDFTPADQAASETLTTALNRCRQALASE
jgi:tetratricopeptide (TPR) repeat protein